jgi:hypothetical protein
MMDPIQGAVAAPAGEIAVHCALRRQVFWHRHPLAARAQDVEDAVDHLPNIDLALVAAALGGWDQRRDEDPLVIRQITRIAQLAAVIATSVLRSPHPMPLAESDEQEES